MHIGKLMLFFLAIISCKNDEPTIAAQRSDGGIVLNIPFKILHKPLDTFK